MFSPPSKFLRGKRSHTTRVNIGGKAGSKPKPGTVRRRAEGFIASDPTVCGVIIVAL
jgi:hypothetical protein